MAAADDDASAPRETCRSSASPRLRVRKKKGSLSEDSAYECGHPGRGPRALLLLVRLHVHEDVVDARHGLDDRVLHPAAEPVGGVERHRRVGLDVDRDAVV